MCMFLLCVCESRCLFVFACMLLGRCVGVRVRMYMWVCLCMSLCAPVCLRVCVSVRGHACVCACVNVCVNICGLCASVS